MNAERRKHIDKIVSLLSEARGLLEEVTDDERNAYDNLPTSIQESERGERMDEVVSTLGQALEDLESIESALEEAKE